MRVAGRRQGPDTKESCRRGHERGDRLPGERAQTCSGPCFAVTPGRLAAFPGPQLHFRKINSIETSSGLQASPFSRGNSVSPLSTGSTEENIGAALLKRARVGFSGLCSSGCWGRGSPPEQRTVIEHPSTAEMFCICTVQYRSRMWLPSTVMWPM